MNQDENLLNELEKIYSGMLAAEKQHQEIIEKALPQRRSSAINLIDYLALRSTNIEVLQIHLHEQGLSSLASSESHIKRQVLRLMERLGSSFLPDVEALDAESGHRLLNSNITTLFGSPDPSSPIPIMVTFDIDFAEDVKKLCSLLERGMRIARINCAHDDQEIWATMIANLNKAKAKTNLPCKIYMDLAGPKIRTQIITSKHRHGKVKVKEGEEIMLTDLKLRNKKDKKFIHCTLSGIVEHLQPGQHIFFDDGLFEAVVLSNQGKSATLQIKRVMARKPEIKSGKGINFPDTDFKVNPVTDYDRACLPFIVKNADMVGFSFVRSAPDMQELQKELTILQQPAFPIIAKIETQQSVDHLPEIILQGMQQGPIGVMVARGDMAVEIGFERMSEIQDEILWICEAAHTPVIWATQVLEHMHKRGIATRSEITDAAHAAQADCVMINKGDFTLQVLTTLNDILKRSRKNKFKNRRLFRQLSIASKFLTRENV